MSCSTEKRTVHIFEEKGRGGKGGGKNWEKPGEEGKKESNFSPAKGFPLVGKGGEKEKEGLLGKFQFLRRERGKKKEGESLGI